MNRFIVMTSSAKTIGRFGTYRNVAVVETDGLAEPKIISNHARHLVRIVHHYGRLSVGSTPRCAYRVALSNAETLAAELNAKTQNGESI